MPWAPRALPHGWGSLSDGVAYMVTRPRTIGELWITPTDQA
ncbi:hypothetical protein ACWDBO_41345 [Streptomyces mirabilis]|nr:hypothetical protein [Streptomyces sp. AK02-04a]MDX3761724.1 hypothetical protein [Streptomyces sp. AK02-04a]